MTEATYSSMSLRVPMSLDEAVGILASEPGRWRPFGGGSDLMVELGTGRSNHKEFLSLFDLPELKEIEVSDDAVTIGSMVTYSEILAHPILIREFPNLAQAARWTGSVAIQNRGTLGGNIGNGSPAADSPPALIVYEAQVELVSVRGSRWVDYCDYHTGYKTSVRAADEVIARIRLPRRFVRWTHYYRKVGPRRALAISKVSMSAVVRKEKGVIKDVRIAFGSVAPTVVRAVAVEKLLVGKNVSSIKVDALCKALGAHVKPIDDIRSTAQYRSKVAENLLCEFIEGLK